MIISVNFLNFLSFLSILYYESDLNERISKAKATQIIDKTYILSRKQIISSLFSVF